MNIMVFQEGLERIYATFARKFPENDRIPEAIYRRVARLPDAFMDFAVARIEDMEKLPANLGRYLFRDLWPEYLDANPELRERRYEQQGCPNCKHDNPGRRLVYEPDGTSHLAACTCCTDRRAIDLLGQPTDAQIWDMGWTLTNPLAVKGDTDTILRLKKIMAGAIRACDEPPRERHAEILRQMEEDF